MLKDKNNRTDIRIHVGNEARDTEGCVLVGKYYTIIGCMNLMKQCSCYGKICLMVGKNY